MGLDRECVKKKLNRFKASWRKSSPAKKAGRQRGNSQGGNERVVTERPAGNQQGA
jgi:hypothetical protein